MKRHLHFFSLASLTLFLICGENVVKAADPRPLVDSMSSFNPYRLRLLMLHDKDETYRYIIERTHPTRAAKNLFYFDIPSGRSTAKAAWGKKDRVTVLAVDIIEHLNGDDVHIFAMSENSFQVIKRSDIDLVKKLIKPKCPDLDVDRYCLHLRGVEGNAVHTFVRFRKGAEIWETNVDFAIDEELKSTIRVGRFFQKTEWSYPMEEY